MSKFLVQGSYTTEGLKGVIKDGGSKRREVVKQLIEGMGGQMEGFYFALGENDFYILGEMPGIIDITATTIMVNATGMVNVKTIALLTPEEVDLAVQKTVNYRPPGQ